MNNDVIHMGPLVVLVIGLHRLDVGPRRRGVTIRGPTERLYYF